MVVRGTYAVLFAALCLAIAGIWNVFPSRSEEVLLGTPFTEGMVPLQATQPGMPVVYVMEPTVVHSKKSAPSSATQLSQTSLASLPVSVAYPLPIGITAKRPAIKRNVVVPKRAVHKTNTGMPTPTAQERRFEAAYPAETEAQAVQRAKILARQDYLETYSAAVKAENLAEVQERKNRAARAQHDAQRASMFKTLKGRADRKEGWVKLEREMGMIMDGVDGLHYKGYHAGAAAASAAPKRPPAA